MKKETVGKQGRSRNRAFVFTEGTGPTLTPALGWPAALPRPTQCGLHHGQPSLWLGQQQALKGDELSLSPFSCALGWPEGQDHKPCRGAPSCVPNLRAVTAPCSHAPPGQSHPCGPLYPAHTVKDTF